MQVKAIYSAGLFPPQRMHHSVLFNQISLISCRKDSTNRNSHGELKMAAGDRFLHQVVNMSSCQCLH